MRHWWMVLLVLAVWVGVPSAEVIVDVHSEPLERVGSENRLGSCLPGGVVETGTKSNVPADSFWFLPFFEADMTEPGDSTYFSVRNDDSAQLTVDIQYFDVSFSHQKTETIELVPHEVKPVALRNVSGLATDPDGYARGMVRLSPSGLIFVDSFQLETRNSFAVGGVGYVTDDFCERWNARFLRFGASGGTRLVILANGPRGADPGDPVTVEGNVFAENGDFINSFTVRTDEWFFEIPVHDFVLGGVEFGTVELTINAQFSPAGLVEVRHQALGEFSVGHLATCAD